MSENEGLNTPIYCIFDGRMMIDRWNWVSNSKTNPAFHFLSRVVGMFLLLKCCSVDDNDFYSSTSMIFPYFSHLKSEQKKGWYEDSPAQSSRPGPGHLINDPMELLLYVAQ